MFDVVINVTDRLIGTRCAIHPGRVWEMTVSDVVVSVQADYAAHGERGVEGCTLGATGRGNTTEPAMPGREDKDQ
jgi:hypothetical protein